jgi:hypothetical protein
MEKQLDSIKQKLKQLKGLDRNLTLFGAHRHKYKLNPILSEDKIRHFEETYRVTLPIEYVAFFTKIGNGGAGPFLGLEPFDNALFDDVDYKRPDSSLNPNKPFLHIEPWNLEFTTTIDEEENEIEYEKDYSRFEEQYFDKEQMNGVIV